MSALRFGVAKAGDPLVALMRCTPRDMPVLRFGLAKVGRQFVALVRCFKGHNRFALSPGLGRPALGGLLATLLQMPVRFPL